MTQSFALKLNSRREQSMVCSTLLCLLGTRPSFPPPLCLAWFFIRTYQEESTLSSFSSFSSTELGVFISSGETFCHLAALHPYDFESRFCCLARRDFFRLKLEHLFYIIIHSIHRKRFLYPLPMYQNICFNVPPVLVGISLLWASGKNRKIS